jgi:hypothetical protein
MLVKFIESSQFFSKFENTSELEKHYRKENSLFCLGSHGDPEKLKQCLVDYCLEGSLNGSTCPYFLHCEPGKTLENGECVETMIFEKWRENLKKYTESRIFIYDEKELKNFVKINSQEVVGKKSPILLTAFVESNQELQLIKYRDLSYCPFINFELENYGDSHSKIKTVMMALLVPHISSIVFFMIILYFFITLDNLRKTIQGKCWIMFLSHSLINYGAVVFTMYLFITLKDDVQYFKRYWGVRNKLIYINERSGGLMAILVLYTEFSMYICLNVTCFETFYMIRSSVNNTLSRRESKRLIFYYLICFLVPISIPLYYHLEHYDHILWLIMEQRFYSGFNFQYETQYYMETFGLFEIIIKTITFCFFLGSCYYIWRYYRDIRNLNMRIHTVKKSRLDR